VRAPSSRPGGIPVSSVDALQSAIRRTSAQRTALTIAAVALLAAAIIQATSAKAAPPGVSQGRSGVILLDLSRSISPARMAIIRNVLGHFAAPNDRVGLVAFSDTAYELLPPGTSGTELRPIIRFFTPVPKPTQTTKLVMPSTPWDITFRGGTRLSTGLDVARQALARQGLRGEPVLLVSDLSIFTEDLPNVTSELVDLHRDHIPFRIIALEPTPGNQALFERLAGQKAFLPVSSLGVRGAQISAPPAARSPLPAGLVASAVALLGLLAFNELWCGRLAVPGTKSKTPA
jgi:von Willebrand factor type A domain